MAINIPNVPLPLSGLNQAIATGGNLFSQMINPAIQRENNARQWRQHLDSLALQKQQMAHAARNDDLQRAILSQQLKALQQKNDPNAQFNALKNLITNLQSLKGGTQNQQPDNMLSFSSLLQPQEQGQGPMQEQTPFLGALAQNEMEGQQQPNAEQNKLPGGINIDDIIHGLVYKSAGLTPPKAGTESPEQKRKAELESKIEFEKEKAKLADEKTRAATIKTAENDSKVLEDSLDGLKRIKKIIEKNPDLFGHNWQGHDRFLKSTENKNAGKMQALLKDFILDAEKKASSRGSQQALKWASTTKPAFDQTQQVALGNVEESIRKIEKALADSKTIAKGGNNGELTFNPATGRLE